MLRVLSVFVLAGMVALTLTTGCSDDDDDNGVTPPAEGACCAADGTCTVDTEANCNAGGGTYQGDGTDCEPNPCEQPIDQTEVVRAALDTWISSGNPPVITAQALLDNISENPADDPYILSVRSATHYAIGHIPGAANIGWRAVGTAANLTELPMDRQIVVYCYTGHTGQLATTALAAMGYDTINLKFGMCSWTSADSVRATTCFSEDQVVDGPTETGTVAFTETYDLPVLDVSASTDNIEIIQAAFNEAWSEAGPVITAQALLDNISENPADDPFILSVRSADHFETAGHIQGAYNIPWRSVMDPDNLQYLPTDQQIVVYCYTGHTGQVAATALRMLGYDAINLKHGMTAWSSDPNVRQTSAFSEDGVVDGPLEQ